MIAESGFNLAAYAQRVAEMTDDELLEEGKEIRKVIYPTRISGTGPSCLVVTRDLPRKFSRVLRDFLPHLETFGLLTSATRSSRFRC